MKILNRYGKACRYKIGDIVQLSQEVTEDNVYMVTGANFIGRKGFGFWEIFFEDKKGNKFSRLRPQKIKKIKNGDKLWKK